MEVKTEEHFCKNKAKKDGLDIYCKECNSEKRKKVEKKRCSTCKALKPLNMFTKNSARHDGLNNWCKSCRRIYEMNKKGVNQEELQRRINERGIGLDGYPLGTDLDKIKTCPQCKKDKSLKEFYFIPSKRFYHFCCKECAKENDKIKAKKRKEKIINKFMGVCDEQ